MKSHEKEYSKKLPNGTAFKVKISVEIENFNKDDHRDVFGSLAECARDFYLVELKSVMGTD